VNPELPIEWASLNGWLLLTRLGEAQVLLPAMLAALLWLAWSQRTTAMAFGWLAGTGVVAMLTTASKVAFFGFAVGYAPLDFTGVSGHAMFAAAVLPVLAVVCTGDAAPRRRVMTACGGYALAALIAYSRLKVNAHSASEALSGLLLGSLASAWVLRGWHRPVARPPLWLALGLLLWMTSLPLSAPPSLTHDWVVRLSLAVSDRTVPYSRWRMHRDHRLLKLRKVLDTGEWAPPSLARGPGQVN
jgi:membrane-associated phospholipid phosphatase